MAARDKQSFVALMVAEYGGRLRRFLKLKLSNPSDVPDLAQEVFMRLMRVDNFTEIRSPEAYLFTIASHVVHQHAQKHASIPESLEITELFAELQLIADDDPPTNVESEQRLRELEAALDQLPPRVAIALIEHRLAGKSVQQIARELGVAKITVKKYLARALLHCRDKCEKSIGSDPR